VHDSNPFPEMEIEFLSFLLRESELNMLLTAVLFSDACNFPYLKPGHTAFLQICIEYCLITEIVLKDVSRGRKIYDGGVN
jgi:hypothetical protein